MDACRLNVMQPFRNVTGAVIIIYRVLLRGLYSDGGKIGVLGMGMFAFSFSLAVADMLLERRKRAACRSG